MPARGREHAAGRPVRRAGRGVHRARRGVPSARDAVVRTNVVSGGPRREWRARARVTRDAGAHPCPKAPSGRGLGRGAEGGGRGAGGGGPGAGAGGGGRRAGARGAEGGGGRAGLACSFKSTL